MCRLIRGGYTRLGDGTDPEAIDPQFFETSRPRRENPVYFTTSLLGSDGGPLAKELALQGLDCRWRIQSVTLQPVVDTALDIARREGDAVVCQLLEKEDPT